jgi:hypothetical protein
VSTHAETYALVFRLLADRLPTLSREELTFRITPAATGVAGMIVGPFDRSTMADNPPVRRDENTLDRSVAFIVAGLSAPPTPPPSGYPPVGQVGAGRGRERLTWSSSAASSSGASTPAGAPTGTASRRPAAAWTAR